MKPSERTARDSMQVACFSVGGEEYAVDIMKIKEIINPVRITPVPKAPPFIDGIIELRGAILPVVDLRKRFDLEPTALNRDSKYIVTALDGRIVGLVVDKVREVTRIDLDDLRSAPAMAVGESARFFTGVFQRDGRIVMLVDLDQILSTTEKVALRELGRT